MNVHEECIFCEGRINAEQSCAYETTMREDTEAVMAGTERLSNTPITRSNIDKSLTE